MNRDINAAFDVLRGIAGEAIGLGLDAKLSSQEHKRLCALADASLTLLQRLLLDVNRIADAAEARARSNTYSDFDQRGR